MSIFDLLLLRVVVLGLFQRLNETTYLSPDDFIKQAALYGNPFKSQSPLRLQAVAARIFHPHRHAIAAAVFYFNLHAKVQALAPLVFHFNHHAMEQALAPGVFQPGRRYFAPMFFHPGHSAPGQALASDRFFRKLRSD
jgi:hypothetical protein